MVFSPAREVNYSAGGGEQHFQSATPVQLQKRYLEPLRVNFYNQILRQFHRKVKHHAGPYPTPSDGWITAMTAVGLSSYQHIYWSLEDLGRTSALVDLAAVLTDQVQGGFWYRSSGYPLALAHIWWKEVHTVLICKGAAGLMAPFVGQSGLYHMKTEGGGTELRSPLTSCSAHKKLK